MAIKRKSKFIESAQSKELSKAEKIVKEKVSLSPDELREIESMAESDEEKALMQAEMLAQKVAKASLTEAKKKINNEVPVQYLSSRPSGGATEGIVTYHMRETYAFMLGRKKPKPELLGLFGAAARLKTIVQGYYAGCPYACWRLVELEDEIVNIKKQMKSIKQEAQALVNHSTSIVIQKFEAKRPTQVTLSFSVPYAYHLADLLVSYDDILRIMAKYKEKHFISPEEFYAIENKMGKPLRRAFNKTGNWYFVGQEAVDTESPQLLQAESSMGILPDNIKNGERLPTMISKKLTKVKV